MQRVPQADQTRAEVSEAVLQVGSLAAGGRLCKRDYGDMKSLLFTQLQKSFSFLRRKNNPFCFNRYDERF